MKIGFPAQLYVTKEQDGDDSFEIAHPSLDAIPEDEKGNAVAVYELKLVKILTVTKKLS